MLQAYFDRIGYGGTPRVDLPTLTTLQHLHLSAIPFEALDVLGGKRVLLAIPSIMEKLVARRRGGYCFEQNNLFAHVLTELGFEVRRVMARVLWHHDPDAPRPPRSHLALIVTVSGQEWLVDVGFGGSVPDRPLRLESGERQETLHDSYRFQPGREGRLLSVLRDGEWTPAYELTPGVVEPLDLELANWYTSTHPDSSFRKALVVSRCTKDARFGLYERQYSIRHRGGQSQQRTLSEEDLVLVLKSDFQLPPEALAVLGF